MENQETARQVVGWAFTLVPCIFLYVLGKWYRDLSKTQLPARTQGVVTSSNVSGVAPYASVNSVWTPRIEYSYSVNGREYTSCQIGLVDVYYAKFIAKLLYSRYTEGAIVTVHYDPEKPNTCALHPNSWKFIVGSLIVFVLVFPLIGILALFGRIGQ
jgi:hypothetical protein